MRLAIRFALFALCLREAVAQAPPDVAEILKKVGETYRAAKKYEFVADVTSHEAGSGAHAVSHMLLAFEAPNRYRMEGKIPLADAPPEVREAVIVDDGSVLWFYLPKSNQYASIRASTLTPNSPGDLGDLMPETADDFMMSLYRGAADLAHDAKYLRDDTIEMEFTKIGCYLVTISAQGQAHTWWIDKHRYRILRDESDDEDVVFAEIKLNEPLPNALFQFKPPPGARKIEFTH